jgi:hypothetical protein
LRPLRATLPTLLAVVAMALSGCGRDEVTDYCSYGAVSRAQLEGCESHVTTEIVESYDTNAARYAKGKLDECLADAGPFCTPR